MISSGILQALIVPYDSQSFDSPGKPRLLVVELWGLGDLTFATSILGAAMEQYEITLVAKKHALPLLQRSFPGVRFKAYDPPWTAYRRKYDLLQWKWHELFTLVATLRESRFDAAVSVRPDSRDHLLMWLSGATKRYGYPTKTSFFFLNRRVPPRPLKEHRVENWRALGRALGLVGMDSAEPRLHHAAYRSVVIDRLLEGAKSPIICLHAGARIATRRWPESSYAFILKQMRADYCFHLVLIPDPDGYGSALAPLADTVATGLTIPEMVDLLGRADLLVCNDSGPAHIAAACGRPVISVFGPTDPDWFYPWGNKARVIIRDICPWRPCFDYCKFSEPHCLTKLAPDTAWPEVCGHVEQLLAGGVLPQTLRRAAGLLPVTSHA